MGPSRRREFFCRSPDASDWAQPLGSLRDGILAPRLPLQLREEGASRAALAEHHGEAGSGRRAPSTEVAHPKAEAGRGSPPGKTEEGPPPTRANAQLSALPCRARPAQHRGRARSVAAAPTGQGRGPGGLLEPRSAASWDKRLAEVQESKPARARRGLRAPSGWHKGGGDLRPRAPPPLLPVRCVPRPGGSSAGGLCAALGPIIDMLKQQ